MRLLLDTHAFIWCDLTPERLSPRVQAAIRDTGNSVHLSLVSVWEMQIKMQNEKLRLSKSLTEVIEEQRATNGIVIQPVTLEDILGLADLPLHHRDPFDRLLVAQARQENFELVSSDPHLASYDVRLFW